MKITLHQKPNGRGETERACEGIQSDVYALKVELEGTEKVAPERIEIAYNGAFYRLEPQSDGLAFSIVGVPVKKLSIYPQSAQKILIRGLQQPKDV
jgi:hypothetical protein